MDHKKIYESIIEKAKLQNRQKVDKSNENYFYYEDHHIHPKCLKGDDELENLVLLTAREHFICHKLLTFIYANNRKIAIAFHHMAYNKKYEKFVSARDYAYAKELMSLTPISDETKEKFKEIRQGKTYDEIYGKEKGEEVRNNISKNHSKYWLGKHQSLESIEKRILANTGKIRTEESKEKIRQALLGIKFSEERKRNISNSLKGKHFSKNFGSLKYGENNPSFKKITTDELKLIIDLHTNKNFSSKKIAKNLNNKFSYGKILKVLRENNVYKKSKYCKKDV